MDNRGIWHAREVDPSIRPMLAGIGRDPPIESDFVYQSLPASLNLMRMKTVLPFGLDWETCDRARLARDPTFDGVFFHRRADNPRLFSPGLRSATRKIRECSVLCHGGCRRAGGFSAMYALQARSGAGEPGMERDGNHRRAGHAAD
jgi:hypothetical protein